MVTRRCLERRFFLRPSRTTNEIFLYVLAAAAKRTGVLVHAFCVLSNHVHLVVTDPKARLPAFMQYLDSLVARAMNESLGRFEDFWSGNGYSAVEPLAPGDVVARVAYVLANPVAAGLVRTGAEWPGLWSAPERIGAEKIVARRPDAFFDPKGGMPAEVELELTVPPGFTVDEFRSELCDALRDLEATRRRELAEQGRKILGPARVLAQSPFAKPTSCERRFGLNPRIAARDKWRRIEGLQRLKTFVQEYRRAWAARRAGVANVVFPAGTYLLRVLHGVQCAGAA
jgi:REP element-mobilizing transposase RayT